MKKVMVLGAANGQIPFISICKEMGCYVICASVKGDYPGFKIADKCCYVDTRDKEELLKIALDEKIDVITSDQTDVSMPAVAYVSEKMGIKSIGYETSVAFSNKYVMRLRAAELGVAVPAFYKASTEKEALDGLGTIELPAVMKPVDSSGSRGVRKINNTGDLKKFFEETKGYSKNGEVIIEEFIEGREYLADGLAIDGKFINTDLGIKEYFDKDGMYISKMCMFTSAAVIKEPDELAVLEANRKMAEGLHLRFGITHGEYIVSNKNKKAYLVEIAARGGGVYLSSHLTPAACGLNTNRILLDYLINNNAVDVKSLRLDTRTAAWMCFELPEGEIVSIEGGEELKNIPGVFLVCLDGIYEGKKISAMKDDTGKMGPILIKGANREECGKVISKVKDTLKITVKDKNGALKNMIW